MRRYFSKAFGSSCVLVLRNYSSYVGVDVIENIGNTFYSARQGPRFRRVEGWIDHRCLAI